MNIQREVYFSRLLLGVFTVLALLCSLLIFRAGVEINTDLRSLSPTIAQHAVINSALDSMSNDAARQLLFILLHQDQETLAAASDYFQDLIEANEDNIRRRDQAQLLQDYLDIISAHPFGLLTSEGQRQLQNTSDEALQELGRSRLYGSAGATRLVPLQRDPLGFVNDFADTALTALTGPASEEIQSAVLANEQIFFVTHTLELHRNGLDMEAQAEALKRLQEAEAALVTQYPDMRVLHSGVFFFAADAAQHSRNDISFITTGSAVGVLLLLLWVFRSIKALLLPLLSIFSGCLFAFVICQALFGSVHILTIVFGASLIGVVIDYSLHYFYFHSGGAQTNTSPLHRALLLSLLTSVIGYSALSWSGLLALKQVALFSGLGLIFAWLVVISMGPLMVKKIRLHDRGLHTAVDFFLTQLARLKLRYLLSGVIGIGIMLMLISGFSFPVNDSPRAFFSPNPQLVLEEQQANHLTASYEPGSFIVIQGDSDEEVYQRIAQLEEQLAGDQPKLLGAHRFFPSPQQSRENYLLNARLYHEKAIALHFMVEAGFTENAVTALAQQYLTDRDHWLSPGDFFSRTHQDIPPLWVEQDQRIYSFLLIPRTLNPRDLRDTVNNIDGAQYVNLMEGSTAALAHLRHSALALLMLAFALITLLMVIRFKSWRKAFGLLTIPACALIGTLLIFAAATIPLTLFHVMALFLVLGLGMDYVIFAAEMREDTHHTLSAITLSAVTSLLSFGLLSASALPAVAGFGLTVLIGNSINFAGSLLLASRYSHPNQHP